MEPEVGSTMRAIAIFFFGKVSLDNKAQQDCLPVKIELFPAPVLV